AVAATLPAVPDAAGFVSFGIPDLRAFARPIAPAEPDYFELGDPARSGGIRHRVLDDGAVFDVAAIRREFPILTERVNGHQLVWLDNAATTQKPQAVIDRLTHFYRHENSNIHRAAHELAARATNAYEEARETVRRFLNAPRVEDIVFVRGATEAINLVAFAWGDAHVSPGDEILITNLEHHANTVPWQRLAQRTGAVLKVAPVDDTGTLILSEFERLLSPRTKLVAATHVSNALGTVNPVAEIVQIAHRHGARVLIDAAQSVPHARVDVQEIGADFVVFSGHKVFGPTGIGVLYGSEEALAETSPWQTGGNMIADVTYERSIFQPPPNTFEAGTGNIADAVGLGEALRFVEHIGIERIAAYEHDLVASTQPRLAAIPGLRVIGTAAHKASVISFVIDGHDSVRIGQRLNEAGIAVRAGHHCAQPILRRLGVETTVRPSFAFYNTFGEADRLVAEVERIVATPNG
ncbi:SufS family cysteine desulfurase, partial [Microbacterium sp.]|uniref:SufS family cysteine desulfurase n=1 Tax=Microbacterium sp. TaxID=51671 RepID=UPI003C7693CD